MERDTVRRPGAAGHDGQENRNLGGFVELHLHVLNDLDQPMVQRILQYLVLCRKPSRRRHRRRRRRRRKPSSCIGRALSVYMSAVCLHLPLFSGPLIVLVVHLPHPRSSSCKRATKHRTRRTAQGKVKDTSRAAQGEEQRKGRSSARGGAAQGEEQRKGRSSAAEVQVMPRASGRRAAACALDVELEHVHPCQPEPGEHLRTQQPQMYSTACARVRVRVSLSESAI
jgi:UPF0716 family protein affecting phage T7 exclusion